MKWHEHAILDETYKILYRGIDIGLSREFIHDLKSNTGMDISNEDIERMYNHT